MTLMRMPCSVWGIFVASIMGLLAFPALFVAAIMMLLDRIVGTSFFMPAVISMGQQLEHGGGSPILFQHLFWFFGHRSDEHTSELQSLMRISSAVLFFKKTNHQVAHI